MIRLLPLLVLLAASPALAQSREPLRIAPGAPNVPLPGAAPEGRIVVTSDTCARLLIEHQPSADATYRPGVDVYGRPVAPADLPSGAPSTGRPLSMTDLVIDSRRVRGLPGARLRGETYVGSVAVMADGTVLLDGQPVGGDGRSDLAEACRQAYR